MGLEQSQYDPFTKKFYISRPAVGSNAGGVDVIDPLTMQVTTTYSTPSCSPAGLVITPTHHAVTSCGGVVDLLSGNVITTVSGVSADQIWYNPGDNLIYFGAAKAGIIDAETNQLVTYLPEAAGHTLAVDPWNNKIFAPVTGAGIKVFAAQ